MCYFQIIENKKGKASIETLDLFRHLMVDIISVTVFGSRPGALDNWAIGIQDPLSQAVYDFPTRGIVVRAAVDGIIIGKLTFTFFQRSAIPTWAWNLACRIPNERWRRICNSDKTMAEVRQGSIPSSSR